MDISKVTYMVGMLDGSGLSTENFDATLIGWAAQLTEMKDAGVTIPDLEIGAQGLTYIAASADARDVLTKAGWTFEGPSPTLVNGNVPDAEDDAGVVEMGASGTFDVLANDSDADGDSLKVIAATADNGSVAVEEGGRLTYTPNDGFFGEDTVQYTIEDEHEATDTADLIVTVIEAETEAEAETEEEVEDDSNDFFVEVFAAVGVFMLILMASGM